jgi:hypothetical protein
MRSKMKRRLDIVRILVSLFDDIAFDKFLFSAVDTIEDTPSGRICQVGPQLNLNQFSTNSQPTKRLFCGII